MELCSVNSDTNRFLESQVLTKEQENDQKANVDRLKASMHKYPDFFREFLASTFENDYPDVIAAIFLDPAEALYTLQGWIEKAMQAKADAMVTCGEVIEEFPAEDPEDFYIKQLEERAPK